MRYGIAAIGLCAWLAVTGPAAAGDFKVSQREKAFSERDLRIRAGDTVTFVNADTVTHNVYSRSRGMEFEISSQVPGSANTIPFQNPGIAEVQCAIHPKMRLQIHVGR